jgi:hypothetical protein
MRLLPVRLLTSAYFFTPHERDNFVPRTLNHVVAQLGQFLVQPCIVMNTGRRFEVETRVNKVLVVQNA